LSEMMHLPDIDVAGVLPDDIQLVTVFAAAVCTTSRQAEEAQALISFLASAQAASVKLAHGMQPA
jgi:molybdate transport system substrate-binding protein